MIDINKCEFEDYTGKDLDEHTIYFFAYPKECAEDVGLSAVIETLSHTESVVAICIALEVWDNGDINLTVSPTVYTGDRFYDCDWHDYYDYDEKTVQELFELARR